MGVGKTLVGGMLARMAGRAFVDLDEWIEHTRGQTITEIFAECDERGFRQIEHRALLHVLSRPPSVVATGGGAYLFTRNRRLIDKNGVSVQLAARNSTIWGRIRHDTTRPLLSGDGARERLRILANRRRPVYEMAKLTIRIGSGERPVSVADRILDGLAGRGVAMNRERSCR